MLTSIGATRRPARLVRRIRYLGRHRAPCRWSNMGRRVRETLGLGVASRVCTKLTMPYSVRLHPG
jgi:hypothetical protein